MNDLTNMTDNQLDAEFDRLAEIKEQAQASIKGIRAEKERRRDAEIERLRQLTKETSGAEADRQ